MIASPVKIKDIPHKVQSSRMDLYEEESNKIIGTKGMIFRKSKIANSEKDRFVIFIFLILI